MKSILDIMEELAAAGATAEEMLQIEEDMAYIKSKVSLPELVSYADRDYD